MKKLLIGSILLLSCACFGQDGDSMRRSALRNNTTASDPLLPYLVNQNFEGTGYDNSESWTETGTGTDEDYATSPAPLLGTQSCRITSTAADNRTVFIFASTYTTIYGHVMWHRVSNASTEDIVSFRSTGSARMTIRCNGSGGIIAVNGSTSSTATADTVSTGTTIHLWFKYVNDGSAECAWSTDTTRPTGGNKFTSVTGGAGTTTVDRIYLGDTSGTFEWIFDQVFVDEAGYPQP